MSIRELIAALGGASFVASELRVTPSAVTNWYLRAEVPRGQLLPLWALALRQGVEWQPDGAEEIRTRLAEPRGRAA